MANYHSEIELQDSCSRAQSVTGTGSIADCGESSHVPEDEQPITTDTPLPPVDGGIHAWAFLVGCFFTEALVWGKYPFLITQETPVVFLNEAI